MMDPSRQIDEIHRRLAVTTGFSGFRPEFVLSVALFATAVAVGIELFGFVERSIKDVLYVWIGIAAVIVVITAIGVVIPAARASSRLARAAAKGVSFQLAPVLAVGLSASLLLINNHSELVWILPSLWSAVMGLGIVSMMPYLPAPTGTAALWYFACSVVLYRFAPDTSRELNRAMGIVFGGGHFLTGLLLFKARRS